MNPRSYIAAHTFLEETALARLLDVLHNVSGAAVSLARELNGTILG